MIALLILRNVCHHPNSIIIIYQRDFKQILITGQTLQITNLKIIIFSVINDELYHEDILSWTGYKVFKLTLGLI